MQPTKKHIEKYVKNKLWINEWMRNRGFDDGDTTNMEELEETLIDFKDAFEKKIREEVIREIGDQVLPKAEKFIDKVNSGRARSIETYADMKEIVKYFDQF